MYLGLGKSIIQFVVPPPGHGPLDILSGRQSEHFKIKWGQAYVVVIICPLIGIGLFICQVEVGTNPRCPNMFQRACLEDAEAPGVDLNYSNKMRSTKYNITFTCN